MTDDLLSFLRSLGPAAPTVEGRRRSFEAIAEKMGSPAADLRIEAAGIGGPGALWLCAHGAVEDAAILFLHGGGYTVGSPAAYREFVGRIAISSGLRALCVDYRLAPEHPFPAALDDAAEAYSGLLKLGLAPDRIVIAGDSAGGGLAVATLLKLKSLGARLPAAAALVSPWTDLALTGGSIDANARRDPLVQRASAAMSVERYLGPSGDRRDPLASPLYGDLSGLPPMLIQVGSAESLLDDSLRLAQRAKAAGVEVDLEVWPDMTHIWPFFGTLLPEAQAATTKLGAFLRRRVHRSA